MLKTVKNYEFNTYFLLLIKKIYLVLLIISLGVFVLIHSTSAAKGVSNGIRLCLGTLIPSLFPFVFISCCAVKSGISATTGKIIVKPMEFLFNLPGIAGTTILLSLFGGYLTGAKGIKMLLEQGQITKKQATRMLCFCINPGPAFMLNVVGVLYNRQIAQIIFLFQTFLSIITGIILGIISRFNENNMGTSNFESYKTHKNISFSSAIVDSCTETIDVMLDMCSIVIVFSMFIEVFNNLGIMTNFLNYLTVPERFKNSFCLFLTTVLEVTNGLKSAVNININPMIIAFTTTFAGLCIHAQVISVMGKNIQKNNFFSKLENNKNHNGFYSKFALAKLFQALIVAIFTNICLVLCKFSVQTFSNVTSKFSQNASSTVTGSLSLIFTCVLFIFSLQMHKNDQPKATSKV